MVTKQGLIKRTPLEQYANIRKTGLIGKMCIRDSCNTDDYAAVAAKASGTVKQGDALLELKH